MTLKTLALASLLTVGTTTSLMAGNCSDLKVGFDFFGAPDNSYIVKNNTFKTMTPTFKDDKLEGATVEIDLMSVDTSADLNNGAAVWPAAMIKIRDMNTKNKFFGLFTAGDGKGLAKITKVSDGALDLEVTMNGKTETIAMTTKVDGDKMVATGKLDINKFAPEAYVTFSKACAGFHKGASNPEITIHFQVPATCK